MVHRLEGDQGEFTVDRVLGQHRVLHTVRPPQQHLASAHRGDIRVLRFGQQHHVAVGQDVLAVGEAGHQGGQFRVRDAEPGGVPVLQRDPGAQIGVQPRQMVGVQRQPTFVRFGRGADHPEVEKAHFFLVVRWSELGASCPLARLSARFSFRDLPDFLVIPCRGDLSLIMAP